MSKETKKLNAEELEKRAAPFVIVQEPTGDDPLGGGGGDDPVQSDPSVPDPGIPEPPQPGRSDERRNTLWHENQV